MDSIQVEEKLTKALRKILPANSNKQIVNKAPNQNQISDLYSFRNITKNLILWGALLLLVAFFSPRTSTNGSNFIGIGNQTIINTAAPSQELQTTAINKEKANKNEKKDKISLLINQ